MSSKVMAFCAALCLMNYCWGDDESLQRDLPHHDIPIEPLDNSSSLDLNEDASIWRFWRPWKLWNWGRNMIEEEFGDIAKSGSGRYRYRHRDHQKPKIKNKVKLLFKIHQFES